MYLKVLCCLFLSLQIANAQKMAILQGDSVAHDLGAYIQTLYDTTGKLTFEQVSSPTYQAKFQNKCTLEKKVKHHWYRVEIDNQTDKSFFQFYVYNIVHSEVYILENGHLTYSTNGFKFPLKKRANLGLGAVHPLQLGRGKTTLYIVFKDVNEYNLYLGKRYFWLHDAQTIYYEGVANSVFRYIILGILLALCIYNAFIYLIVRDKSYLYYVLSVIAMCGYMILGLPHLYTVLEMNSFFEMQVYGQMSNALGWGCVFFFIKFSQSYLDTRLFYPIWHKYLNGFQVFFSFSFLGIIVSAFLINEPQAMEGNFYSIVINDIAIILLCIILLTTSIVAWRLGKVTGKYYVYSNTIFLLSVIIYLGEVMGLYYVNIFISNIMYIGLAIQMLSFSVALASRINLLKQEIAYKKLENERLAKEQAIEIQLLAAKKNIELEQKVKERTTDLEKSNEEIRAQADEIERQARLLDDHKNRQLMEKTLQILQKNELLPEVGKFLEGLNSTLQGETKQTSKELQKKLAQTLTSDSDWENLKAHFEEVHPTLFAKLYEMCPDLTKVDLRYCAYQKMGLSKKEIATLLNLDPESVRKHQYRIKQKLKLEEGVSFTNFIISIH